MIRQTLPNSNLSPHNVNKTHSRRRSRLFHAI